MASRNIKSEKTKLCASRNVKSAPPRVTTTRSIPCHLCTRCFSSPAELSQHKSDKHGTKPTGSIKSVTLPSSGNSKVRHVIISCHSCQRSFSNNNELVQHQRDKHQVKQHISSSFKEESSLKPKPNAGRIKCTFCERVFSTNNELTQHKKDKHNIEQPAVKHPASIFSGARSSATGVNCRYCSKSFSTNNELSQHQKDKHQINQLSLRPQTSVQTHENKSHNAKHHCSLCNKTFTAHNELLQHNMDKYSRKSQSASLQAKTVDVKKAACSTCGNFFNNEVELQQHRKDKHGTSNASTQRTPNLCVGSYICSRCSSRFLTETALLQHVKDKHQLKPNDKQTNAVVQREKSVNSTFKCSECGSSFPTNSQLVQHRTDKHRTNTGAVPKTRLTKQEQIDCQRNKRKKTIDEYYDKKVDIDKDEKKASLKLVNETLFKIMSHVHGQTGGDIYCPNHVKAGSFPVNTKIGKPDEFDTNICLKLRPQDVRVCRDRKITYAYSKSEHATNMNVKCELDKTKGVKIPDGYAVASVAGDGIPKDLRHGGDIVPREMRHDLHQKLKTAINDLRMTHVNLSRDAHGPALTMTIRPSKHSTIHHHISVDITLSLPCDEPIKKWPRRETKQAFSEKLINDVKETGTHLVPKKDEFWAVSYSKAERALFSSVDEGNGCRKFVYKMLKKHMQSCKSRSQNGLPGLSSHILKTQILWSCEKHTAPDYWHYNNRDICLVDALADLEKTLKSGHLQDYFDTSVDLLKSKEPAVCHELANFLHDKKVELEQE